MMKQYWQSLTPAMQHVHVFLVAFCVPVLPDLLGGQVPSKETLLVGLGMGIAACLGLALPISKA